MAGEAEKKCATEGCDREKSPKAGRGMCYRCYSRWWRARGRSGKKCSADGCEKAAVSRGLCQGHYQRWWQQRRPAGGTGKKCTFEGCEKPVFARGLCKGHYMQQKRGQVLRPLKENPRNEVPWNRDDDLRTKLEAARDDTEPDENGCWNWQWATRPDGYGCVYEPEFGVWRTHRASFHVFVRPIRTSEVIHHRCANRACWNPDHLQATSAQANTAEMLERNTYLKEIRISKAELDDLRFEVAALEDFLASCGLEDEFAAWCAEQEENDLDPPA